MERQPKCSSTDKWIKKMWYIYNGILLGHKKEWNLNTCDNMSEITQTDKDKYYMILLIAESKEQTEWINKTETAP